MKKQLARLACPLPSRGSLFRRAPPRHRRPCDRPHVRHPQRKGPMDLLFDGDTYRVGTCAVTDTLAQQAYAARTDWDIAIADGRIRTNSGTSGPGDEA